MSDRTSTIPPEVQAAIEAQEALAKKELEVLRDLGQLNAAINVAADFAEVHPEAGFQSFLASPPDPSILRRKVAESTGLSGDGRTHIKELDQTTLNLPCNFCGAVLSADLKWALFPLMVTVPAQSTLACLRCTELAFRARSREARVDALKKRGHLRRIRSLPLVGPVLQNGIVFADYWSALSWTNRFWIVAGMGVVGRVVWGLR